MLFSRTGWTRKSDCLHEQVHEQTRAIRNFNLYLYGQPVLLRIDNAAVSWMRNLKTPTGQVVRWLHITCCSPTWMHYQETIVRQESASANSDSEDEIPEKYNDCSNVRAITRSRQ